MSMHFNDSLMPFHFLLWNPTNPNEAKLKNLKKLEKYKSLQTYSEILFLYTQFTLNIKN